jgi:hypothetical protein
MKIQPATLLKAEDFPALMTASKGEVEKLFRALNVAISSIVLALTRNLTAADNLSAAVTTQTFKALPVKFKHGLASKPSGVLVLAAYDATAKTQVPVSLSSPGWSLDGDQIVISSLGTLSAGVTYAATFVVLGS